MDSSMTDVFSDLVAFLFLRFRTSVDIACA